VKTSRIDVRYWHKASIQRDIAQRLSRRDLDNAEIFAARQRQMARKSCRTVGNRTTIDSFRLVRARGSALSRDGNALQSEAASSIGSGLSVVGKIIGNGTLTIFGHVEGEVRAPTIVIAEGAQIEGKVSAEELTVGGYVKGTIDANRVELNSTAVVKGDIIPSNTGDRGE
jgi:hypothetical protein